MPKRPEINAADFAKAIESEPIAIIPFDPQMFGAAANNGQMIAEVSANHRTTEMFLQIAQRLTGRGETKKPRGRSCQPLIEKLRAQIASTSGVPSVFGKRSGPMRVIRGPAKPAAARAGASGAPAAAPRRAAAPLRRRLARRSAPRRSRRRRRRPSMRGDPTTTTRSRRRSSAP